MTAREFGEIMAVLWMNLEGEPTRTDYLRWWSGLKDCRADEIRGVAYDTLQASLAFEEIGYLTPTEIKLRRHNASSREADGFFARIFDEPNPRFVPYQDYLATFHWNATRIAAIVRSGGRCARCGYGEELNVHHLNYHDLGAEKDEDLQVLCRPCHRSAHVAAS